MTASRITAPATPRARRSFIRPLDRYVFSEFWRIFITTALGFPFLLIVIDLTDHLDNYLANNVPRMNIALGYLYGLPDSMFNVLPAAVLFATVFSIGAFTRHSEITAAKASGISFYRFIAPVFVGAVIATVLGLGIGELAPRATKRRLELLQTQKSSSSDERYNFAYAAEYGRTYVIRALHQAQGLLDGVVIQRQGKGPNYPSYVLSAQSARYRNDRGWLMTSGTMHVIPDGNTNLTVAFDSAVDHHFTEQPQELTASPKAPADMDYRELGRFIRAMERSGADVNELRVERMLKITIPITCLVILLFGAPLATSTQRGGTAYGVGVSLATTVIFLMLIQMTKAIGGKGMLFPELAAWLPSLLFGVVGLVLLVRVRT